MNREVYEKLMEQARGEAMQEKTAAYLTRHLKTFVEPGETALICFREHEKDNLSGLMERAVLACGGRPVLWGEDRRWRTLLRLAFTSRATTIIGTPLEILGLSKLKKYNGIPLAIRNAVTAGYPCFDWMVDGIVRGFDCRLWKCFGLGLSGLAAGFSCPHIRGVHLRSEEYSLEILDGQGRPLKPGETGRWALYPKDQPELKWGGGEFGRLDLAPCPCGSPSPKVLGLRPDDADDPELSELAEYLLSWTSVLDCNLHRGPYGLEIKLVIFPGEKLPKLPTCARRVVRPWNPEKDEPFPELPVRKNTLSWADTH